MFAFNNYYSRREDLSIQKMYLLLKITFELKNKVLQITHEQVKNSSFSNATKKGFQRDLRK